MLKIYTIFDIGVLFAGGNGRPTHRNVSTVITRHTSCLTRHTSHVTRHTSHHVISRHVTSHHVTTSSSGSCAYSTYFQYTTISGSVGGKYGGLSADDVGLCY